MVLQFGMFIMSVADSARLRHLGGVVVDGIAVTRPTGEIGSSPVVVHERVAVMIQETPQSSELKQFVNGPRSISRVCSILTSPSLLQYNGVSMTIHWTISLQSG